MSRPGDEGIGVEIYQEIYHLKELYEIIADEIQTKPEYVKNVITLLDEGNTIPFIARYRKEAHGSLDDTNLRKLEERLQYLRGLEERKQAILHQIEEQGALTEELHKRIEEAQTLSALEDLYRPFKQKKKTRASAAKEKGLEPLAKFLLRQGAGDPEAEAEGFVDPEKGVETVEAALNGAQDIIAEMISDDPDNREFLRKAGWKTGELQARAAKEEDSVYRQYYDFTQPLQRVRGYQVLAVNRGEKEGFLKVKIALEDERLKERLLEKQRFKHSPSRRYLEAACEDSYARLLKPSLEREFRSSLTDSACEGAIDNFALNLKPLLMQPPVKGKVTMGLDPGYSHGCKVAVVDGTGKVLDTGVVYPTFSEKKKAEAIRTLKDLIRKHGVEHISLGNGTASRETQEVVCELIAELKDQSVSYAIVNEAGASVYSASETAAEEFPQYDVNIRSAISIARRLQDPLAELVKIDPMAIGVGQYQHDMPQAKLENALNGVVEDCVNTVGVDLNSASPSLLRRVAGLSAVTAKNIVAYREKNGVFQSRRELLKVPKLGPKSYEQCAGFLRVPESKEILDHTGVHPESYPAAGQLLELCGYSREDVKNKAITDLKKKISGFGTHKLADAIGVGVPTMLDIADELMKPGRDPREDLPPVVLHKGILDIKDLTPGMKLKGTVRNVTDFGAFVDIGVHQDGLVHISQLADRYVKHPSDVVKVGDIVEVTVLEADAERKRIALSMK